MKFVHLLPNQFVYLTCNWFWGSEAETGVLLYGAMECDSGEISETKLGRVESSFLSRDSLRGRKCA